MAETFRLRIYRKLPRFLVLSAGKLHKSEKWVPLATSLIFVGKKDIGKKKVLLFHLICKKSTSKVFFCWSISNCLPQNKWFFLIFCMAGTSKGSQRQVSGSDVSWQSWRQLSCTTWVLDGSWKSQVFAIELSIALSSGAIWRDVWWCLVCKYVASNRRFFSSRLVKYC